MTRMVREPSPQFQKQSSFSPVAEGAVLCFAVLRIWVKYSDSGSQAKFATFCLSSDAAFAQCMTAYSV